MKITDLMNNQYAWLVLAFCTVAAFAFAIYTWFAGRRKKELAYTTNSYKIIQKGKSLIPELEISYRNKNIEDLTITKYAIWNSGNEVIDSSDIVESKKLMIILKGEKESILNSEIIAESDESNNFRIDLLQDNTALINFDYIDPKEGAIIQIAHTGNNDSLQVDCKIKGGRIIRNSSKKINKKISRRSYRNLTTILMGIFVALMTFLCIGTFLFVWGAISQETYELLKNDNVVVDKILSVIMLLLWGSMIFVFCSMVKRSYHIDIPSKLRKFIEYDELEDY